MSIEVNPSNTARDANGTTAERQFDALLRLTNLVNRADVGILSSFALTLDDADQRTQVVREDGKVYTYGYDAIGQLTNASATLPDGSLWSGYQFSYAYDATGNPVEQNKNGLVYSNSFNNLNQIVTGSLTGATVTVAGSANYSAGSNCVCNISGKTRKQFSGKAISKQTNTEVEKHGSTKMKQRTKNEMDRETIGGQRDRVECQ